MKVLSSLGVDRGSRKRGGTLLAGQGYGGSDNGRSDGKPAHDPAGLRPEAGAGRGRRGRRQDGDRRYLQYCGHEVAAAATVEESFAKAEQFHPEVLICDWKLAGRRDGIDVARALRQRFDLAVIFITAYALADLRRQAADLGTVSCLRKPISLDTLAALLDAVDTPPRG